MVRRAPTPATGSLRMPSSADVAQLVERRLPKPKVAGSSPVVRLTKAPPRETGGRLLHEAAGEDWLRYTLDAARRGTLPGVVLTGATFADAAAEWLRYVAEDRDVKPSTLTDCRSVVSSRLLPEFGALPLEDVTARRIENWRASLGEGRLLTNRTRNKAVSILGGIMERARKAYGLPSNPVRDVEKLRERRYDATRFDFYSPEEVRALVRATASEQDGALFLTAAFTRLRRGELIALR